LIILDDLVEHFIDLAAHLVDLVAQFVDLATHLVVHIEVGIMVDY